MRSHPPALRRAVFILSVSIHVGTTTVHLDGASLKIFKQLPGFRNRLVGRRAAAQNRLMSFCPPYWFATAEELPALQDEIAQLLAIAEQLKQELLAGYEAEYQNFLTRSAGSGRFPTREEVERSFAVVLHGPMLLSELGFEVHQSLSQPQQAALQQLRQYRLSTVRGSLAIAIESARSESYRLIDELLATIEAIEVPGRFSAHLKTRLDNQLRRLQTTMHLATAIGDEGDELIGIVEQMEQLKQQAGTFISRDILLAGANRVRARRRHS